MWLCRYVLRLAGKITSDDSTKTKPARETEKTPTCQSAAQPSRVPQTIQNITDSFSTRVLWTEYLILTVVGELHSLTDWQVSDASEDAELDDF